LSLPTKTGSDKLRRQSGPASIECRRLSRLRLDDATKHKAVVFRIVYELKIYGPTFSDHKSESIFSPLTSKRLFWRDVHSAASIGK
tara:strand:+ start:1713 stop:1970 length:258 start_codon:yes stop_codon:yes gene_type:complete